MSDTPPSGAVTRVIEWAPNPAVPNGGPLGRHVEHDPRSRDFLAPTAPQVVTTFHNHSGPVLDQGCYGACTGFSGADDADSDPDYGGSQRTVHDALALYAANTRNDGFGPPYFNVGDPCGSPGDRGSSGLGMAKSMVQAGWASSYTHAFDLNSALQALVLRPVSIGSNWYDSMDSPDADGLVVITANASVRGGHEYTLIGVDAERKLVQALNSWGPSWGVVAPNAPSGGVFWMSWDTLGRLLSEQGDVTVPIVTAPAPTPTPTPPAPTPTPPGPTPPSPTPPPPSPGPPPPTPNPPHWWQSDWEAFEQWWKRVWGSP